MELICQYSDFGKRIVVSVIDSKCTYQVMNKHSKPGKHCCFVLISFICTIKLQLPTRYNLKGVVTSIHFFLTVYEHGVTKMLRSMFV